MMTTRAVVVTAVVAVAKSLTYLLTCTRVDAAVELTHQLYLQRTHYSQEAIKIIATVKINGGDYFSNIDPGLFLVRQGYL